MNTSSKLFLFDGQGAFTPGFGKGWMKEPIFKSTFCGISDFTGLDLADYAWGPKARTTARRNGELQITLFALNLAIANLVREKIGEPSLVTGHSLGEICALVFSGSVSVEEGAKLVSLRGRLMESVGIKEPQDMLVLLTNEHQVVERVVAKSKDIFVSNRNSPDQIVIAGKLAPLKDIAITFSKTYRMASKLLGTGVACHTPLLAPVEQQMNEAIAKISIESPSIPFFSVGADQLLGDPQKIRNYLSEQMTTTVEWGRAMKTLCSSGHLEAVEIGPSKILKGLAMTSNTNFKVRTFQEILIDGLVSN